MLINYDKTRGDGAIVTDCLNLRPDSRGDTSVLVPAGVPKLVAPCGYKPLVADGDNLLATQGNTIYSFSIRGEAGAPREACTLPYPALCAVVAGECVWVMTEAGAFQLARGNGGDYTVKRAPVAWPGVSLSGAFSHVVEAEVAGGDLDSVGSRLCDAYADLDRQAAATGTFVQPIIARVRITDSEGHVLHVGPPVVVSGPDGAQLCGGIRFETAGAGDERSTKARMISARAWQLNVSTADTLEAPWRDLAARLEVQITPQFHPYNRDARAVITTLRGSAEGEISVQMPGSEAGLSGLDSVGVNGRLEAVTARFDALAKTVAYINRPYAAPLDECLTVSRPGVESEVLSMSKALGECIAVTPYTLASLNVPHTFTANCGAENAATLLWGNAGAVPFGGYDAAWFAATRGTKSWRGSVSVDFADGSRVATTLTGHANPLTLSPMLSYPLPSAVRLTLSVHTDGDEHPRVVSVPLHPDGSGTRAVWMADDLQPVALEISSDFEPAEPIPAAVQKPLLVAARATDASTACAAMAVPGAVTAIEAVKCSAPTRDSQPAHFYVATNSHIDIVTATPSSSALSAARLTTEGVASQAALAQAGEAVYALSNGNLLKLSSMSVDTVTYNVEGDAICFDTASGELMVVDYDDNECRHFMTRQGMLCYHTSLVAGGLAAGRFAITAEGVVDLTQRTAGAQTHILWRVRQVVNKERPAHINEIEWLAKGSDVHLSMSAERTWLGDGVVNPAALAQVKVDGRLLSPVTMPLNTHPAREIALRVSGTVSADFAMTHPIIGQENKKTGK